MQAQLINDTYIIDISWLLARHSGWRVELFSLYFISVLDGPIYMEFDNKIQIYNQGHIASEKRILEPRNYLKKKVFGERGGDVGCTK
jgi:hypothetical protein